jgi:hypothetical protein
METNEQLADKYPVKYSRDGGVDVNALDGDRITLGYLVMKFADLASRVVDPSRSSELADWLDREFLFGCWGDVMREVRERNFGRDINGFIVAAFSEGRLRCRNCYPPAEKKPEPDPVQWCWREKNAEIAHGPLSSREDAIEEARAESESRTVMIGNVVWPDPVEVAGETADVDYLLEQMEEYAYDNGLSHDDSIFDLKASNCKEAQEGLKKHLRAWAEEFVAAPTYWHSDDEEEVEIHPRCPKCDSPQAHLHPAVQHEGEVQQCDDPFHNPEVDDRTTGRS